MRHDKNGWQGTSRFLSPASIITFMRPLGNTPNPHRRQRQVLRAVAGFEFFKGIFVILMGICAIALVHKDTWLIAESLLALLHISTDRHLAQLFLDFADSITDARLWAAARIAFAYAALRFTEAYGLWKGRTWAEWVALISGTLLLPLEVRELFRGVTAVRCSLLLGNLAVVFFMLYIILANRRERRKALSLSNPPKAASGARTGV
ncbi:MAG TPA: DUF2127 domain-containing protein [Candidatus Sulfotelmatobacter sp.]|nr:DUF2127 domain-containing protein [Candidatus Sulfotelmatobacter sp.]